MGTASKQPSKKEVKRPPRTTGKCALCNRLVPLSNMQQHIVTCRG